MHTKKLYRSRTQRILGGVCGGLGEYFGINPANIRLAFILLTILGFSGPLIYLILLVIVPIAPLETSVEQDTIPAPLDKQL